MARYEIKSIRRLIGSAAYNVHHGHPDDTSSLNFELLEKMLEHHYTGGGVFILTKTEIVYRRYKEVPFQVQRHDVLCRSI